MKFIKKSYKLFILLYLFWILLSLNFKITNLLIGGIISLLVVFISFGVSFNNKGIKYKLPKAFILIKYSIILFIEIYKSSFAHIKRVLKCDCSPIIIKVKLETKDPFIITIISNSITLTPGTITVDTDGSELTVLCIEDDGENGESYARTIKERFEKIFL
ncbi:MAG: hypothetical protein FH753_16820 [Firmicutes bacterium]|nr:hypothetical protein [Bacillota bacterium]